MPAFSAPTQPDNTTAEREKDLKELKKQIQEALNQDNNLILNTHYTLLGIAELLDLSREFFTFYGYQCENLRLNNNHYNTLKSEMLEISNFVNNTLLDISTRHKNTQKLYETCERILDDAQRESAELSDEFLKVKETLRLLEEIKQNATDLETLRNSLNAQVAQAEALKEQVTLLANTLLQEAQTQLLSDKENYEQELRAKKDEYVLIFDERLTLLQEKINDFNSAWILKEQKCDETINIIEKFKVKINEFEHQMGIAQAGRLSELKQSTNTHKVSLEEFKTQKIQELTQDVETYKEAKLTELDNYNTTLRTQLDLTKDDFLRDINAVNAVQIQEIKELFMQIANNRATLGSDYRSTTFTSSSQFTPIRGILDYFVFVRGGNGASLGTASGGMSSFGNYLSASGGAGNQSGSGQRGEARSSFIRLRNDTERVNVSVAGGGIVVVSYASSENAALDLSFLNAADREALRIVFNYANDTILNQNLTTTAQVNKARNILTIAKATSLNAQLPKTFNNREYNNLLALKCAIALAFLDNNTPINQSIASLNAPAPIPPQASGGGGRVSYLPESFFTDNNNRNMILLMQAYFTDREDDIISLAETPESANDLREIISLAETIDLQGHDTIPMTGWTIDPSDPLGELKLKTIVAGKIVWENMSYDEAMRELFLI
ncbi:hypothetical protein [Helicobacter himalayensis]|uniref:hypothetical protein n=1 Tax=Helicobacter himalayensis TaxID=1591088 RepID=UPI0008329B6B|nr:hypothetical protein [Helicobacter himalayensis]